MNTPFHLIPSFYIFTGILKQHPNVQVSAPVDAMALPAGSSRTVDPDASVVSIVKHEIEHLKNDWLEASFGSAIFWTPLVYANFKFVPQHSRIMTIVTASFLHKTWLSWLAHRESVTIEAHEQQHAQEQVWVSSDEILSVEPANIVELAHENFRKDADALGLTTPTATKVEIVTTQTREFIGFAGGTAASAASTAGFVYATTAGGRRPGGLFRFHPRNSPSLLNQPRSIPPVRCFVDVHRQELPTPDGSISSQWQDLPAPGAPVVNRY